MGSVLLKDRGHTIFYCYFFITGKIMKLYQEPNLALCVPADTYRVTGNRPLLSGRKFVTTARLILLPFLADLLWLINSMHETY